MFIPILLILFALGAYLGPLLLAQEGKAGIAPPPTKAAVVNVRAVFKENRFAKAFQADLEEKLKPNKMRTMEDMGCTVPVYIHGSVDITPVVIETLRPLTETRPK